MEFDANLSLEHSELRCLAIVCAPTVILRRLPPKIDIPHRSVIGQFRSEELVKMFLTFGLPM
eukprot:9403559-Karenia_brevis.AAC.1